MSKEQKLTVSVPEKIARQYENLGRIHGLLEAEYGTHSMDCEISLIHDDQKPLTLSGHFTFHKEPDKEDKDRVVYHFQGHHKQPDSSKQSLEVVTDEKWQHLMAGGNPYPFLTARAYNLGDNTQIRISALK